MEAEPLSLSDPMYIFILVAVQRVSHHLATS